MSGTRIATGGSRIDRSRPLRFVFNGRDYQGFAGDTLASAVLAAGDTVLSRSWKYHRPRSICCQARPTSVPRSSICQDSKAWHSRVRGLSRATSTNA